MKFRIPFSISVGIAFIIIALSALPLLPIFITFPIAMLFLAIGLKFGFITKPSFKDIFLVPFVIAIELLFLLYIALKSFAIVSWIEIIFAGSVVALILLALAFIPGINIIRMIPILGNIFGSLAVFVVTSSIVSGFPGVILASIASIIAFVSIPIPGINQIIAIIQSLAVLITFIVIKTIAVVLVG